MQRNEAINGVRFDQTLSIPPDVFDGRIDFSNCQIKDFNADCVQIFSPVKFENCVIGDMSCHGAYFFGGFSMRNCTVNGRLGFDSGGHNDNGDFELLDCQFAGPVDFAGCWFTGPVRIVNATFKSGTNLFGNTDTPVSVTFDVAPSVVDSAGRLDCNTFE